MFQAIIFVSIKHFIKQNVQKAWQKKPFVQHIETDLMDESQRAQKQEGIHFHVVKWAAALSVYFLESAGVEDAVASHKAAAPLPG